VGGPGGPEMKPYDLAKKKEGKGKRGRSKRASFPAKTSKKENKKIRRSVHRILKEKKEWGKTGRDSAPLSKSKIVKEKKIK